MRVFSYTTLLATILGCNGVQGEELKAKTQDVVLSTIPRHVYKVLDRLDSQEKSECWYFHLIVQDKQSRTLEPLTASIMLYSGSSVREKLDFDATALRGRKHVSLGNNAGIDEAVDLSHHFCEPATLAIDRLRYELELGGSNLHKTRASIEIPVRRYFQKTKLVFPIKGNFIVVNGSVTEGGHHERSQLFAYDIVPLGPHLDMITGQGTNNEEFVGWGREVIAPAAGLVTYSRNDVPDNPKPGTIDLNVLRNLPDQPWPLAGNVVVIDHGEGEFSVLAHMQMGSVRVKRGDRVKQADILGLVGNSGHAEGPHLHYHLMDGELLFKSDGLPSHFENVEGGTPTQGQVSEAK